MRNQDRIEGLRAVQSQFEANVAQEGRLNAEMRTFLADPDETAPQRAEEFGERLHAVYRERKLIIARLAQLDPAFSAAMN